MWREVDPASAADRSVQAWGVRIAPEIHAPTPLRSKIVDDYLAFADEEGAGHFGLLIDTGIFQTERRTDGHGGGGDARMVFGYLRPSSRRGRAEIVAARRHPAELVELVPHVVHVHAKFWDMTDDLTDPHIPYDGGGRRRSSRPATAARSRASTKARATSTARPEWCGASR